MNGELEIRGRIYKVTSYLNVTKRGLVDDHDTEKKAKHLCTSTSHTRTQSRAEVGHNGRTASHHMSAELIEAKCVCVCVDRIDNDK